MIFLAGTSGVGVSGGEGGIRTPGTDLSPFDGLANRCFRPLSHLSAKWVGSLAMVTLANLLLHSGKRIRTCRRVPPRKDFPSGATRRQRMIRSVGCRKEPRECRCDGSGLSAMASRGAFLQFSFPVRLGSQWSRDLERASKILLERSLHTGQRMAQVHEEATAKRPALDGE